MPSARASRFSRRGRWIEYRSATGAARRADRLRGIAGEAVRLAALLRPGGRMIVSMKHPFVQQTLIQEKGYRARSKVELPWPTGEIVTQVQRPLGEITGAFQYAGLVIEALIEPYPDAEFREHRPLFWQMAMRHVPLFIQFVLRKPA